jgi:NADH pyrophosphatase NudC (nudix superfamily)
MKIVFPAMRLRSQKSEKHSSNQLVTELSKGAWFDKDHLPHIPEKLSIARQLIDAWLEEVAR